MYESMLDLEEGKSYACKYKVETFLGDNNLPATPDNPVSNAGTYEGLGVIIKRDLEQKLVELEDVENKLIFVVDWKDCWDIDDVIWETTENNA